MGTFTELDNKPTNPAMSIKGNDGSAGLRPKITAKKEPVKRPIIKEGLVKPTLIPDDIETDEAVAIIKIKTIYNIEVGKLIKKSFTEKI